MHDPLTDAPQPIVRVVPLTTTRALRGLFDYRLPPGVGDVGVGSLLRVPFAGRTLTAVVAETAPRSEVPDDRLVAATGVLPTRLPPDLVALARWMADEYCSTPARCLSLLLPPGAAAGAGEKRVLNATLTPAGAAALLDPSVRVSAGQREALERLSFAGGPVATSEIGTALLRRLEARGLVMIGDATFRRVPPRHDVASAAAAAPVLTNEQSAALAPVLAALASTSSAADGAGSEQFLLHGVTGSGKTEVYLAAAQAALAAGRAALILVPEIGLTPQALQRFTARLGDVVAVIHSGLSDGARRDEWLRLARGEARVCVGPRSAVFAPLSRIGLIVVDEDHESSYKHEGDPRYDARTVAARRAKQHGAVLLLGSATPRPESIPDTIHLRLARRVDGRPLPEVEILDTRAGHHALHPQTRLALADVRRSGGKAIVLLNRRGWSNFLSCGDCGRVWMCPNCDVALVLHRASGSIACHHCGHRERVPPRCPTCASVSVARHGTGTERLEHDLLDVLEPDPDLFPVLRLDADTAASGDRGAEILARFQRAPAGVLVGTQMIAKGHDFPGIGLGVVVDADQTLRFPDFRAEERTFALVTQLAGRTGRGGAGAGSADAGVIEAGPKGRGAGDRGRVLVQTTSPGARPIVLAARHDSDAFLDGELDRRRALGYPPFATLIRIVCSSPEPEPPAAAARAILGRIDAPGAQVLGPAPLFMLRARHRIQLLVKARDRPAAVTAVGRAVDAVATAKEHRGVAISVDVDPQ